MFQVVKRDGEIADFQMSKITSAIDKAFDAKEKIYSKDMIDLLGLRVTADFQNKIQNNKVTVEDIQDSVENVLIQAGYSDVAKAYILYRKQREKIRNMKSTILDYKDVVNSYVKIEDWRVKENSTVTYSVGGLILNNSGAITANYWLSEIYDEEIANAHRSGRVDRRGSRLRCGGFGWLGAMWFPRASLTAENNPGRRSGRTATHSWPPGARRGANGGRPRPGRNRIFLLFQRRNSALRR